MSWIRCAPGVLKPAGRGRSLGKVTSECLERLEAENAVRIAKATWSHGLRMVSVLALALAGGSPHPLMAQAGVQGQWRTLSNQVPINPVHMALMNNGQVLIVAGSGNVATETNFQAAVWDPLSQTFLTQPLSWDMFCNGMVVLHDGRVFINGGNLEYDPFLGEPRNAVYDPATGVFTNVQNMAHGRWYPTTTTLGDGSVMTFSGLSETGSTNSSVEIYTVGSGWSQEFSSGWTPPLYPRMHLSTDGRVFYAGSTRSSRFFNPSTRTWSSVVATTNYANSRTYGTSVLLPLTPANGYRPRVMIFGGADPATATTEIIDLSAATPQWQFGPSMSQPRIQMNATILPNGKVLATGGSRNNEDALTASLNADLYDPSTNTFSPAGANAHPRLYHSNALLLPDATVLLMGGNPQRGSYEGRPEIYSPAYLFNTDGTPAYRPIITGLVPGTVGYGAAFQVQTPDAADIASVVLVRPGAPTHAFDMEQRLVGLSYTVGNGVLNVTSPPNGNIAPPGYYMLFVLNAAGVPSVSRFIRVTPSAPNQAPVATIVSPVTSVTRNPGETVSFSGSGSDPDGSITGYAWTFPGGTPAASPAASPGDVTYSTPGSYVASFRVTDNLGLASQPATRTVTVSDFSLSATPASRTVAPGGNTSYSATVTPANGFTGAVSFSVLGLPSGATGTFTPASVTTSGTTTLSVSTSTTTPVGTYPLTIRATSGPVTRTANVTLVVASGDFTIAVTPTSRTVARNSVTSYTVTVTAGQGFSGAVNLTVSGVPARTTATFNPASIQSSGTSVLTVSVARNAQKRTSTLTITGTGGGQVHSVNATLVVQ
ncbi:MAG TPA: galactose oxidase-like domain-containing protein [Vicinamibacterales bacterium]|nr:galactose oxidase-like domain-containing protein [Vicinamibacterales bacterium]